MDETDLVNDCFERLSDATNSQPNFFRKHLDILFNVCTTIGLNKDYDSECRKMAMEVIDSLCESGGGMIRKKKNLVQQYVQALITMMIEMEFSEKWEEEDGSDNSDGDIRIFYIIF